MTEYYLIIFPLSVFCSFSSVISKQKIFYFKKKNVFLKNIYKEHDFACGLGKAFFLFTTTLLKKKCWLQITYQPLLRILIHFFNFFGRPTCVFSWLKIQPWKSLLQLHKIKKSLFFQNIFHTSFFLIWLQFCKACSCTPSLLS